MNAEQFMKGYSKISSDNKNATYFSSKTMYEFAEDFAAMKLEEANQEWVSTSKESPAQHQKVEVIGEGTYYEETDKVVFSPDGWYVSIEEFKLWRPCP